MFDVVNTSATARGFSIEDLTLQQAAGYFITAPSGFPLVGNEAEFIVERPGGDKNNPIDGLFPLANYVWSIWDFCRAQTLSGTSYGQGDTGAGTYHVSMLDDSGKNIISVPSVDKGVQQLSVMDQGCAFRGEAAYSNDGSRRAASVPGQRGFGGIRPLPLASKMLIQSPSYFSLPANKKLHLGSATGALPLEKGQPDSGPSPFVNP
jgi:hypothetical protein